MFELFSDSDEILSVEETASLLKVGQQAVYRLLQTGEMHAFKNGKVWRIPKAGVREYVLRQSRLK